ncbi:MAG: LysR family transcriptional regulator [Clostridia bacterium]|nr:LysR family transcriptional regulator [Clostridia bacterium]
MDLLTLRYFKQIANGKTYFDVAEEFHISQSSVSKKIMHLEEELHTSLFDRSGRNVVLTRAGSYLLSMIDEIDPIITDTVRKIEGLTKPKEISVGIIPHTDYMNLEMRIPASSFLRENPDIHLNLVGENYQDESFEYLRRDEIDFLVTKLFQITRDYCEYEVAEEDPMYVILRQDHRLAGEKEIDFASLYHEHIITRSFVVRRALQESCNALGMDMLPNLEFVRSRTSSINRLMILNMVSVGQGITFYFRNDLHPLNMRNLAMVPVVNVPEFPVVLARKKGRKLDDTEQKCWDYLKQELSVANW